LGYIGVMDNEDKQTLKHISETLDQLLVVSSKPPNKVTKIFEITATGITILGIIGIIEIIRNWIIGG
jgi:preprotein translocase subunit Sss1